MAHTTAFQAIPSHDIHPSVAGLLADDNKESPREDCISALYRMPLFSDITLRVGPPGNQRFYLLHRLVIGGQSSVLFELCNLDGPVSLDGLPLPYIEPAVFDHVVRWLYKYKLTDRDEDAAILMKVFEAAELLKIQTLAQQALSTLQIIVKRRKNLNDPANKASDRNTTSFDSGEGTIVNGQGQQKTSLKNTVASASNASVTTDCTDKASLTSSGIKTEPKSWDKVKDLMARVARPKAPIAETGKDTSRFSEIFRRNTRRARTLSRVITETSITRPSIDGPLVSETPINSTPGPSSTKPGETQLAALQAFRKRTEAPLPDIPFAAKDTSHD
ncbi:hypothetical protein ABW21_db0203292 [Orbilia brochopaga]|nr:hypothetical protein ABW21_db0203292 [Drechslerella brochopaga]